MVEKFSILKSFEAIDAANIIILVIDASEGVTDQDTTLLGMIEDSGKSLIIVVNKWDGMETSDKERVKHLLSRKFSFHRLCTIPFHIGTTWYWRRQYI